MNEAEEELGILEPFVGAVADEPVELRADERRRPFTTERPHIGDERQVLRERTVFRLGVAQLEPKPPHLPTSRATRIASDAVGMTVTEAEKWLPSLRR